MKKIIFSLAVLLSCFALSAETWTVGGVSYTVTRGTATWPGTSWHTKVEKVSLSGSNGDKLNVFYSYTDLSNYDVAVEAVSAGNKFGTEGTVAQMSSKVTSGKAIAGVNADFFTGSIPCGTFINQGTAHKAFTGDGFSAICIDQNKKPYIGKLTSHSCWIGSQRTGGQVAYCTAAAINTTSANATNCGVSEQVIFYTPKYSSSTSGNASAGGYAVQLKPVNGAKLTIGKGQMFEVVSSPSSGSVTIPSDGIVLFGKGSSNGTGVKSLQVGDKISVYLSMQLTNINGALSMDANHNEGNIQIQNAVGGSMMILSGGNVISTSSNYYDTNNGNPSGDEPRSAVGFTANKTHLILCVVDGRNSGVSNGCSTRMLADIMKALGCVDALNFDGGGSSQFWAGGSTINNAGKNNGGSARAVANSLFITEVPGATLSASASSLSYTTKDNAATAKSVTATVTNWRTNVSLSLSGTDADQFALSTTSIAKSSTGSGSVTVTYKPTKAGTHTATLTLTTNKYTNETISKTITLSGTNTETVVEPDPEPENPVEPNPNPEPEPETPAYKKGLNIVWQNTTNVPGTAASGDIRFAAVSNGNLIANDKANNKIITINATGSADYFNPSDKLTEYYGKNVGTAISSDDAGNILVNTDFPNAGSSTKFAIISADLKNVYKLDLSAITGHPSTRADQVGRVRGNMLSAEGGYFTVLPCSPGSKDAGTYVAQQKAVIVKIKNGTLDTSVSKVTADLSIDLTTSDLAQPAYQTVSEIDGLTDKAQSFVMRSRGNPASVYTWNNSKFEKTYTFSAKTSDGYTTTNASVEGFDWFVLDGKSYFIMPMNVDGTTGNRGSAFAIYNEDGTIEACWTTGQKNGLGAAMGSIIAVPNNEHSVYIYHFVPGVVAEKLCFATQDIMTGIEEVAEDVEAPVEYYNLQGVRVINPSNGLYIKRQGNKVSKVIL